ncbi:MAG: hypothetical protein ACON5B_02300 [Myxococcota bacterium]
MVRMFAVLSALLGSFAVAEAATPWAEDSLIDANPDAPVALRFQAEVGTLATLKHTLQIGSNGTKVNVPKQLGQNTLYPFLRFQADLDIGNKGRRNTIAFLYQPLDLRSELSTLSDITVGDQTYAAGTGMDFRYGFSFWRATWLYDIKKERDIEVAFGLALQIRNANILYAPKNGGTVVATRDIGPVPLLAFRGRGSLTKKLWMSGEVTGFYAPIRYLNGGNVDVEGSIIDTSLKIGLAGPKGADAFLGLRWVAGGASGTSDNPDPFAGDGFTDNYIHLASLTAGFALR